MRDKEGVLMGQGRISFVGGTLSNGFGTQNHTKEQGGYLEAWKDGEAHSSSLDGSLVRYWRENLKGHEHFVSTDRNDTERQGGDR